MKMYKVHDSMRCRLAHIRDNLQTQMDLHQEFDTMTYDEACKVARLLDKAENMCFRASYKEVDGRTIKFLAQFIKDHESLAA